jgi:uncharacterized peroxidase-related enzyme
VAHLHDLRSEVPPEHAAKAGAIARDWRGAPLTPRERALCEYAMKLTDAPPRVSEADLAPLRAAGLDDDGINDAVQVIAYFNYINRIAEGLGVDAEDFLADA